MSLGNYIIFGAGAIGRQAIEYIGKENIDFYIDNSSEKQSKDFYGFKVYSLEDAAELIKDQTVVIAVSGKYLNEIKNQIENSKIKKYETIIEAKIRFTKENIEKRVDYIGIYNKAIEWIKNNTVENEGIINSSNIRKSYPEVTGYYIPTLIRWGYRDLAVQYAKWLCSIQKDDGSWYDTYDKSPYVFDTAQILKGLIAVREIYPYVDENIIKGCDWVLSNMQDTGRLTTPDMYAWGEKRTCSEIIHLYCLSPLKEAGVIFGKNEYISAAERILEYYKKNNYDEIMNFGLLSHFYAYVMEALLDMGEADMAKEAMKRITKFQNADGMIPAYNNVHWVCSTGLFQLALVWFRLGNIECGNKAFEYACKLQNESGGWYGSYMTEESNKEENDYFPTGEISWAVKYFLDALYYKNIAEFNFHASDFLDSIDKNDGRYICIKEAVNSEKSLKVLDVGCGKGRYLKNLTEDVPQNKYYGIDLSENVMEGIGGYGITKEFGSLTDIPYSDNSFDIVYTCEALEHAVDIKSAIKEMARVTKPGGTIIVIDKNKSMLGAMDIGAWESWFDINELSDIMSEYCYDIEIFENIPYENKKNGLFCGWYGTVKERIKMNNEYDICLENWLNGIYSEIKFWDNFIKTNGNIFYEKKQDEYKILINKNRHFVLEDDLSKDMYGKDFYFIDVGSGPFSRCGFATDKVKLHHMAVDPLADVYKIIKSNAGIDNGVNLQSGFCELLDKKFKPNTFDLVHMSNSLDHSFDPVLGIYQLLNICKIGGKVILRHKKNEAENAWYEGFHQWNLLVDYDEKQFLIWRNEETYNITEIFKDYADIECYQDPLERIFQRVVLKKKKDISIPKNDLYDILFEKIYNFMINNILNDVISGNKSPKNIFINNMVNKIEKVKQDEFTDYCKKQEINKIVIYGYGTIGEKLVELVDKSNIEYIVLDKREISNEKITTIRPNNYQFDKSVDKIVITVFDGKEKIKEGFIKLGYENEKIEYVKDFIK